jgi:predicted RNA-binding Zn-ribbon protein involved in translation (DUF1610 family)
MYCYHCGKKIKERPSLVDQTIGDENTKVAFICPRCGHLIHEGLTEENSKELSRASHAQIQRGSNSFATGMSLTLVGVILLAIGLLFYILAKKPSQGYILRTDCAEFYVFIALTVISVILLGFGIYKVVTGLITKKHYTELLKDLNNKTFIQ